MLISLPDRVARVLFALAACGAVIGLLAIAAALDNTAEARAQAYAQGWQAGYEQGHKDTLPTVRAAYSQGLAAGREAERALALRNKAGLL